MKTTFDKALLIKKYHTVCSINGMSKEDRDIMLAAYGVQSSKELNETQLSEIIDKLSHGPQVWRRRVMASIGGWLRKCNKTDNADIIKGIACRASGYTTFNDIPISRLRDLYYEFYKKEKAIDLIDLVTSEEIAIQSFQN
jgi:hypothetical protein